MQRLIHAAGRLTGDAQMLDDHPGRHHQQRRDPLIFGKREDVSEQTPEGFACSFGQRRIGRMAVRGRRQFARPLPGLSEQVNPEVFLRQLELTRLLRRIHVSALSGLVVGQFRSYLPWDSSSPVGADSRSRPRLLDHNAWPPIASQGVSNTCP